MLFIPSGIATAIMMPMIGRLLQRGVKQQYLIAIGLFIFFIYSLWAYTILTPDTPSSNFWWLLIVRGLGLSMLFIPVTTLSLSTLHGKQIGDGAAFTGMMRQLGGSFGVALITTFISQRNLSHRTDLVSKLDMTRQVVQQRVSGLEHGFIAKGMTPDKALSSAHKVLDYAVTKQAMVLSYMDVFLYIGVLFLIFVPVVLLIKGARKQKTELAQAMH
jgi:DHA2 family multidrug resistance protein